MFTRGGIFTVSMTFANQNAFSADLASGVYMGQKYRVISSPGHSWNDASAASNGTGGHLAVLTSAAENNYVTSLLLNNGVSGAYCL
ncbi:C-type lectin domain-containing protein [candidate division KSB1 bacterium]|nr:C-type lectin domain-containing protein [candidate division KSB1 bacterium]